jgi:hypothetical protein
MTGPKMMLWWEPREGSRVEDSRSLARFVSGLPAFDSIYQSWLASPETRKEVSPVPLMEDEAKHLLAETAGRYDDGSLWPERGSDFGAGHAGPPPYDFRKSSYADTSCSIGHFGRSASAIPNHIFMRLSELRPSTGQPWRASELRPVMRFAREIWSPAQMCALFSFGSNYLPETSNPISAGKTRPLRPWIGWITYLPPDLAAQAKYPPDTHVETFDDGAVLVTLCEELFDKTDTEGMARLHALEAALRPIQT